MRLTVRKIIPTLTTSLALCVAALLVVSCGGGGGTEPSSPGRISITPSDPPPIPAGGVLSISALVLDTKGQPMSGQTVTFSTSAANIATVSGDGQVTSVGPVGGATITASIGSVHASVSVTVVAGAPASLARTSPDPGAVPPGATAGDSVRFVVRDAFGNPRAQETVTFSVAAGGGQAFPSSAQTDAQGRVATMFITGTAAGTNTLNATVGGVAPILFSLTTAESLVQVSSVSPSPMTPGAVVTITGAGFDPAASGDAVTIDGQIATVTSATATQLVITVPMALPCTPSHQAIVQVTANGASGIGRLTLRVGALRTLTVGSAVVLDSPADINCTELSPAIGRYAVNVLNTSTLPTAITPFRFAGATSIPPGTTLASPAFTLRQSLRAPVFSREITTSEKLSSAHSTMHLQMLESNRLILTRMKSRFRRASQRSIAPSLRASVSVAPPVAVGDLRAFRVFKPSTAVGASASCNDFVEISARVAYVGTKAIIYEDVAAPLAGQMDDKFTQLGQEFDTSMYPSDSNNFGDPLITDVDTDNDQHLNMVFTPVIPSALAGFVLSCDFFPRSATNQVSNFGENFYARVPTVAGTAFDGTDNPVAFLRGMRPTIVHEVKHIAAFGARLENPNTTGFEESWLEEGMAMVAEEVWARDRVYAGAVWKGNMTYQATLYCDVRPTICPDAPFVMFDHFARLYSFLDLPGATSLFGRVSDGDFTFYGASWSFIRYNVDRYATSESAYLRGITSAVSTGITNISQQSGADPVQILGNWSLALYLDGNTAMAASADVNFASWNTRDIFSGMDADFPQTANFPKAYPLVPQLLPFGDFTVDNTGIHGGSFSPYDLIGQAGITRTIGLSAGTSGAPAPVVFRLVVARIQ
jgi:Bacterial Ig-like domain (group 1)/IPT/TIG domain